MISYLKGWQKTEHKNDGDYVGGYCGMELSWNPCNASAGSEYDEKVMWEKELFPIGFWDIKYCHIR